jgi:hypothetical protein
LVTEEQKGECKQRDGKNLRRNQREMLEVSNTVTEMNNAFSEFTSRLDMAEESESLKIS